jgi:hypothetical protein
MGVTANGQCGPCVEPLVPHSLYSIGALAEPDAPRTRDTELTAWSTDAIAVKRAAVESGRNRSQVTQKADADQVLFSGRGGTSTLMDRVFGCSLVSAEYVLTRSFMINRAERCCG